MSDDKGTWIETFTGKRVHLLAPSVDEICIEDIAHALANTCRFNGHCSQFYSVAQHSVAVCDYVLRDTNCRTAARQALMHDAVEAYIGDMVRPLKWCTELGEKFKDVSNRISVVIAERFEFGWPLPDIVRIADDVLLITEARDLLHGFDHWDLVRKDRPPLEHEILPQPPDEAERNFLDRYQQLFGTEILLAAATRSLSAMQEAAEVLDRAGVEGEARDVRDSIEDLSSAIKTMRGDL